MLGGRISIQLEKHTLGNCSRYRVLLRKLANTRYMARWVRIKCIEPRRLTATKIIPFRVQPEPYKSVRHPLAEHMPSSLLQLPLCSLRLVPR